MGKAKEIIFLVEESPEGGYEARALGYSIFTDGETLGEIKKNIRDAVHCHFDEEDMPTLVRIHFVKDELITV
ncbi:MAG: 2-oxoisovalerate dehydrogenase [Thermotogae bacterium]|nr:2-oxoisovalerate dehydrogenase [Thermotogota bacterium]